MITSMKSALAGMYPAMSLDRTESNVGLGGSSVAGSRWNAIHVSIHFNSLLLFTLSKCFIQMRNLAMICFRAVLNPWVCKRVRLKAMAPSAERDSSICRRLSKVEENRGLLMKFFM